MTPSSGSGFWSGNGVQGMGIDSNMPYLRIVTWNCGMALARKALSLLALNPNIAVVQECSKNSVDVF